MGDLSLKDWLPRPDLSRSNKILLVLSSDDEKAKSIEEIRRVAVHSGLPKAKGWNIADILARCGGLAVRTEDGWELNDAGRRHVALILGAVTPPPAATTLRASLTKITDPIAAAFVSEAIECYENKLFRAAVVLSWVGALYVLYSGVVAKHLARFNSEATKRDAKWRPAKNQDGLARMKEHDFLEIIEFLSIVGKSVKEELQSCLKLRNGCGHPNTLSIGEARVAAHIEVLILNVFSKFT